MVFIFFADIKEKSSKVFYNPPPIKLYRIYRKIPKGVPLCTLKETITCECEVPGSTRTPFPTHGGGGGRARAAARNSLPLISRGAKEVAQIKAFSWLFFRNAF